MGIVDWLAKRNGYVKPRPRRRGYAAAKQDRLLAGWLTGNTSANEEARQSNKILRARSRQLERDDDYAKRYMHLMHVNVVGAEGILMQNKATLRTDPRRFDNRVNDIIEQAWQRWGTNRTASLEGDAMWADMQGMFVRTLARDGEVFVRYIDAPVNDYGLALQFLEADHFDEDRNETLRGGNVIVMSVELDATGKPVAYWLTQSHPGDTRATARTRFRRLPAEIILHAYIKDRPGQVRGVPWMHAAMVRMHHLARYERAELVAANVAASKMGFFKTPTGEEYVGDDTDADGNKITEAEPGTFEELPIGQDFVPWDPTHPAGNYEPFTKQQLRGVASGLGVSYSSLTGDLTDVNYSSIRAGTLEQRDMYKVFQQFTIRHFCQPVFRRWVRNSIMTGALPFNLTDMERLARPDWMVRGWEWVDPLKDTTASIQAVQQGLSTRTRELSKQGRDYEETLKELQREQALASEYGVTFGGTATKPASDSQNEKDEDDGNTDGNT